MPKRVVVCLVVAVTVALVPVPAAAKSFHLAAVDVQAVLRPDGSMSVVEHLTYDFRGEFSNGYRGIPTGDYQVVDPQVTEHGRPVPWQVHGGTISWRFHAVDERRTFAVAYTVLAAAKVGPDVGELYWKFVGEDHPPIGRVQVTLTVPGDGRDVRAWAHGPLHGLVRAQGNIVRFSVNGVPPGRFVEGRVTVPADQFAVTPSGPPRLPGILAAEQQLADEANAVRAREAADARRRARLRDAVSVALPVVPLLGWALFLFLWLRYGREHGTPRDVGQYLRELPDDPPAYVPTLVNWGKATPLALSATIVDLAQRGYLTIEEIRRDRWILPDALDWKLTRREPRHEAERAPLRTYERAVLDRLFADGPETTQRDLLEWCSRNRTEAERWWQHVKNGIEAGVRGRRYIERGKEAAMAVNVVAAVAVAGAGLVALSFESPIGLLAIVSGGVQGACTFLLRRRTEAGRRRLAEWEAVERFLRDFSLLEDAPIGSLVLWERYLVYAVALGVTSELARALAARVPAGDTTFAPWFSGTHGGPLDSVGSFSDFASGFGSTVVATASPSSSGSGGGGGFSGGGGGGGGGGSIGAS